MVVCLPVASYIIYGVPQLGSVLGPILFLFCTSPLSDIIRHHKVKFHLYVDDTQLYLTFESSADLAKLTIEDCVEGQDRITCPECLSLPTPATYINFSL